MELLIPPSLPSWDAAHPMVVHFPIALLLLSPILVLVGLPAPRGTWRWGLGVGGLVGILIGAAMAFVAVLTGETAAELVNANWSGPRETLSAVHDHEEAGELARSLFIGVLGLGLVMLFGKHTCSPERRHCWFMTGVKALFALAWIGSSLVLANAAQQGGKLVHEHGVLARSASSMAPASPASPGVPPEAASARGDAEAREDDDVITPPVSTEPRGDHQ